MTKLSLRFLVLAGVVALALAALTYTDRADARPQRATLLAQIDDLRAETWRLQRLMGKPRTRTSYVERTTKGDAYLRWVRDLWRKRALVAAERAAKPPHRSQWLCIHRHESHPVQRWRTRTGNGFYGGLQMNIAFQRRYGAELLRRKGTADRWTPIEQMWVAERAHRTGLGFHPWPNTARYCGLI
jgi:hypothetical protein